MRTAKQMAEALGYIVTYSSTPHLDELLKMEANTVTEGEESE